MADLSLVKKLREELGAGFLDCQKALAECGGDYDKAYEYLRKKGIAKASSKSDRITAEGLCGVLANDKGFAIVKLNCETDFVGKNEKFQTLLNQIVKCALENKTQTVDALLSAQVDGSSVEELIKNGIAIIGENISLGGVVYQDLKSGESAGYYIHNKVEGCENIGRIVSLIVANGADSDASKEFVKKINMHIAAMSPISLDESSVDADVLSKERAIYEEQVSKLNKPAEIAQKMVEGKVRKFYEESVLLNQAFVFDNKLSVQKAIDEFNKANGASLKIVAFYRIAI